MTTGTRRMMLADALRGLAEDARAHRGRLPFSSPERQFFLGVEAAAQGMLRPETYDARPADWIDHEPSEFRNGFLSASAQIAAALTSDELPTRLHLPEPT